jgi:hypothetical protein
MILYLAAVALAFQTRLQTLIQDHFAAIVGLPMVAAVSALTVLLLPQSYGRIEIKAFGISFKGAAGPIILWLLCFLGIASAIKMLW